jgi:hypothetical protein
MVNSKDKTTRIATLDKLLATLSNWRKYCPKHLPHVILLLPTPVCKAFGCTSANCSELPTAYQEWLQDLIPWQVQVLLL